MYLGGDVLATYLECLQMSFCTLALRTAKKSGSFGVGQGRELEIDLQCISKEESGFQTIHYFSDFHFSCILMQHSGRIK